MLITTVTNPSVITIQEPSLRVRFMGYQSSEHTNNSYTATLLHSNIRANHKRLESVSIPRDTIIIYTKTPSFPDCMCSTYTQPKRANTLSELCSPFPYKKRITTPPYNRRLYWTHTLHRAIGQSSRKNAYCKNLHTRTGSHSKDHRIYEQEQETAHSKIKHRTLHSLTKKCRKV